jgi:DNA-binding response OmpR family regulator
VTAIEWRKKATKFAPILVVSAERGVAQRLAEMMRGLGPVPEVIWSGAEGEAWRHVEATHPKLVFVEQPGFEIDGLALVRRLRRSDAPCRQAPVIMMSDEATIGAMRAAQAVGAHEFLIRPFSAHDLAKRLEAVAGTPRNWIEGRVYVGPDRRRFNSAAKGPERRGRPPG